MLGFTYNFENQSTQYQNGVDMHLDWGASQFLTKQFQVGLVGYLYKEIGCDSGSGDRVGCFQSQVVGVGPQVGFIFPVGEMQGYLNFKGYKEFAAENRADGWNTWVTFVISPAAPTPSVNAAAHGHEIARTLAGWESAETIMGLVVTAFGFWPNFDKPRDVFFNKECDFGYDCVFGRNKWTFISKPDHVGALCFESGWDHFACITLACSKHAHDSPKLNLEYVFVIMIHHSRPHCGHLRQRSRFGCC